MNPEVLERVLECRELPSLPAVAMRVIELTNSEKVSVSELAATIQNDQAIAIKILRTVNSSLYGLRQRCSSINQAIVMLGLQTVKTLALGFSLVGAIKEVADSGFDLESHWRRALYSGIAGKAIAGHARLPNADEAFLGGLMQDVGMIALYKALGEEYLAVLDQAGGDHRQVCKHELRELELQHADLGAMLAARWKLPESLVMPIKYHEHPTAAPVEHMGVCRAVGLGNIAADLLTAEDATPHLRKFYQRAEQWFNMSSSDADDVLELIGKSTAEVSKLLAVPTGDISKVQSIIESAREQLAKIDVPEAPTQELPSGHADDTSVDELTGLASRLKFDQTLIAAFEQARAGVTTLCVAVFELDKLDQIRSDYGQDAIDTLLISVGGRIAQVFGPGASHNTLTARYDGSRLAVLATKADRVEMTRLTDAARQAVCARPVQLIAASSGAPPELAVTVSAGLAAIDAATSARLDTTVALTTTLDQALRAAHKAGGNTVRVFAPSTAATKAA